MWEILPDALRPDAALGVNNQPSHEALVKSAPTSLVCSAELMNANATSALFATFSSITRVQ
jgi:hypothetical protein